MRPIAVFTGLVLLCGCGSAKTVEGTAEQPAKSGTEVSAAEAKPSPAGDKPARTMNPAIQDLVKQSEEASKAGNALRAVELLSQAIGLDASHAEVYLKRARAHQSLGQHASALADFGAAIQLEPKNAKLYNERGVFMLSRANVRQATRDLKEAIRLNPKNAQAHNNLGFALLAERKFAAAVSSFDQALKLNDRAVDILNNRGLAHLKMGKPAKAFADFDRAVKLDPKSATGYNNRGLANMDLKRFKDAAADFTAAIERKPDGLLFYRHRRSAYLKSGRTRDARADELRIRRSTRIAAFHQAVGARPYDPAVYAARAEFYRQAGEHKKALEDLNHALKLSKNSAALRTARAAVYLEMKRYHEAVDDCTAAINAESHQQAFSIRGDAYVKLRKYELALSDYNSAKRFDIDVARTYLLHAKALEAKGKKQAAAEARAKAQALSPGLTTSQR